MFFEEDLLESSYFDAYIPEMIYIRQNFQRPQIDDISSAVRKALSRAGTGERILPGMRVAITCGSRGIANYMEITREVCRFAIEHGAKPFIVPSMGSHGGANIEGQLEILNGYNITEENCGSPIRATTEYSVIAHTPDNEEVRINKYAAEADGIIIIGRVKPHTDFRGQYESGLMKMMVVGLGGPYGARAFHEPGAKHMAERLPMFGNLILQNAPVLFGLAILENAYDETALIESVPAVDIPKVEPGLLEKARSLMGRILINDIDLLIVDQIGKDISGDGMDPNVSGTFSTPYASGGLRAKKRTVLDLTDKTHGNMVGIGMADTTTLRCINKCDLKKSYPNGLTCTIFSPFRIPLIMRSDRDAIAACLQFCGDNDKKNPRVIRIRDTMHISEIWISEALLAEAKANPQIEVLSEPQKMLFDSKGNIL